MFARISRRLLPSLRGQSARTATTTTTFYPSSRLSSETGTRTAGIIYPAKGRMIFPTISNSSTGAYNSVVPNVSSTSSSSFTAALPHLLVNSTGVNALGRQTRGCAVVGTSLNQTRSVWQEVIRQVPSDDPNKVGKLTFEDPDLADTRMVRAMRAEAPLRRRPNFVRHEKKWMRRKRMKMERRYLRLQEGVEELKAYIKFKQDNKPDY